MEPRLSSTSLPDYGYIEESPSNSLRVDPSVDSLHVGSGNSPSMTVISDEVIQRFLSQDSDGEQVSAHPHLSLPTTMSVWRWEGKVGG